MNRIILVGRLTKDPELKYTKENKAVVNFTLAVSRSFKNANGEQETDFINVVVFGTPAENIKKYITKGTQIGVDGRIQTRNYEDKDGKKIYVTEVVSENVSFLEPKKNQQAPKEELEQSEYKQTDVNDIYTNFGNEEF